MMKRYDQSVQINLNPNWLYIPDHFYRILIFSSSGSCKTNVLDIEKIHLYVKDLLRLNHPLLINAKDKRGIRKFLKIPRH